MAGLPARRLVVLLPLLLAGCFPYYHPDRGLERERLALQAEAREHPKDPRFPQGLYAVCARLAETLVAQSSPLPLSKRVQAGVSPENAGTGTCCLGGLAFTADLLVVAPLKALRTVFTMPVAWVREGSLKREAEAARTRWLALDPTAGEKPAK